MDILDGTSNTIVVIERANSGISWAEPRDFDATVPAPLPKGNHPGGNMVLFADGSVRFVSQTASAAQVRAAATKDGGETTSLP